MHCLIKAGRKTEYTYDASDRLIEVKQNHGAVTKYAYDQTGNLISITDANENTTTYVYDENGRRVKVILADGVENSCEYDTHGMLVSSTDYNGVTTSYSYDEEDRLMKETTGAEETTYTYDSLGRLTDVATKDSHISYTYNEYGELSEKTYENGQKIAYHYDKYGRNKEIRVMKEDTQLSSTKYEYDIMNRLTRVVGHDGTAVVYTYDANGNRETARFANGQVITYTYDECNRLTLQKAVDRNGTVIAQYQYTLGAGGERTKVTESGACGSLETAYDYDDAGRLIKETIQKGEETTTYKYDYDDVGNRIEKRENSTITTYTYNNRNQLITEKTGTQVVTYSYDANGNLLNQSGAGKAVAYTYDVYNRLVQYAEGDKKESYTYDAEGVRRSKVNGNDTIYYVSDTTGSLSYTLAETDKSGKVLATYNRADMLISQVRGEETSYYLFDGHGDVRALINEEGRISDKYRYNAYGELVERSGETENHYLYTGEYYDGTSNLYYLRARYMNPSTGTFISMDTYEGSIYDPDTLHKYLYANGNPVKYSDPSGHMFTLGDSTLAMGIQGIINDATRILYNGVLNGLISTIITAVTGGSWQDAKDAFVAGFIMGAGLSAVRYFVVGAKIITLARFYVLSATANFIFSVTMTLFAITQGYSEMAIMFSVMVVLSVAEWCWAYGNYLSVDVYCNKGMATIECVSSSQSNAKPSIELNVDSKQLGKKWGKHKFDYPELSSYAEYEVFIHDIFNYPDKIVYDATNNEYLYIKGNDLLRVQLNGNFVSIYPGAESGKVINAVENGGTLWEK